MLLLSLTEDCFSTNGHNKVISVFETESRLGCLKSVGLLYTVSVDFLILS